MRLCAVRSGPLTGRGRSSITPARAPKARPRATGELSLVAMAEKKRQSVRSNRCCFTLNFQGATTWPEKALEEVRASLEEFHQAGKLRFAIVGKEVAPSTGTHHLQGFIHVQPTALPASQGTVGTWKKLFPFLARAHLETARGDDNQNKEYCSKTGELLLELGEPQRKRTLAEFSQMPLTEQLVEDPEMALKSRFQLDSISKKLKLSALMEKVEARHRALFVDPPLRPWQRALLSRLETQDSRQIFFVVDVVGGIGKSHLARYMSLSSTHQAAILEVGKKGDLALAFCTHFIEHENEYTVFDMTRCFGEETWPFGMMEALKNGSFLQPKYESMVFKCYPQKIVVFCNKEPEMNKLSYDRYVKFIVEDNKLVEIYMALFSIPRIYLEVSTLAIVGMAAAAAAEERNVGCSFSFSGAAVVTWLSGAAVVALAPGGLSPG